MRKSGKVPWKTKKKGKDDDDDDEWWVVYGGGGGDDEDFDDDDDDGGCDDDDDDNDGEIWSAVVKSFAFSQCMIHQHGMNCKDFAIIFT